MVRTWSTCARPAWSRGSATTPPRSPRTRTSWSRRRWGRAIPSWRSRTSAGMLAHSLRGLGVDPVFLLGGELPGVGGGGEAANAAWGDGEWLIAEADESDA